MPTLLSLYDVTGNWSSPFKEEYGWKVVALDLKLGHDLRTYGAKKIHALSKAYPDIRGVLAAPPCTDFTVSGAGHWARKDAAGTTEHSLDLVRIVLKFVTYLKPDFWAIENPVGRLPRLLPDILGQPRFSFHPWEFAGWTNPSPEDIQDLQRLRLRNGVGPFKKEDEYLVRRVNSYTKKTCLWGVFNEPVRKPVPDVRLSALGSWLMNYGGISDRTKAVRSETPLGFARAFAHAQVESYKYRTFSLDCPLLFDI